MTLQPATLDVFDDGGALLKEHFPDPSTLPDVVKTAEATEREGHQDADFAVVLTDGREREPRFLMSSPGHTALSVMYFGETHGDLPPEAEKVAAARLAYSCRRYGLGVPALLDDLRDTENHGTPYVMLEGGQEVTKVAEAPGEESYALGERFPLSSAQEIKAAVHYFDDNAVRMDPEDRHEFAFNVAQAAEDAGMRVPESLEKSAGRDLNPSWQSHFLTRRHILEEREAPVEHVQALEKIASVAGDVAPLELAQGLAHFDRRTGLSESWGRELFDAYDSCMTKVAKVERIDLATQKEYRAGVPEQEFIDAAANSSVMVRIRDMFGSDFADKFSRDPVATYKSAPPRLSTILGRIVMGWGVGG